MEDRKCSKCGGDGPFPPKGSTCIACKKAYKQEWDRRNKEHVSVYNHERFLSNPQDRANRTAQWREAHPEEVKRNNRKASRKRNRTKEGHAYHLAWQRANKERIAGYYRKARTKKD